MTNLQNFKIEKNERTQGYCCTFNFRGQKYYASSAVVPGFLDDEWEEEWDNDDVIPQIGETMIFPYLEGIDRPNYGNEKYCERYRKENVIQSRLLYDIERFCLLEEW